MGIQTTLTITDEQKSLLMTLYQRLLEKNSFKNICTFCCQWGKNYPFEEKSGFLFVGKAVNGWVTSDTDVFELFNDSNPNRIFARKDQMEWVHNLYGNKHGYNTRKSAFWRLIKMISERYYPDDWYSNVAWSNLYKIAPYNGGNPNVKLQTFQREYCIEILNKEIEIFNPKYVVFLTSGWEDPFIKKLNGFDKMMEVGKTQWGKYQTKMIDINGTYFIVTHHPQGKKELTHRNVIIDLIQKTNEYKS
ncbi:hypothetical protein [Balneola vulgaris]|uniref:hypothetical protein n=1 Tax=Balneola vulgaris TaxID=287535 RepID=UPI00037AD591|nr:hypothetical protein [Balneola vulgaris]